MIWLPDDFPSVVFCLSELTLRGHVINLLGHVCIAVKLIPCACPLKSNSFHLLFAYFLIKDT